MSSLDVTLLRPFWLLLLPVLLVVGWLLWSRRGGLGDWDRATDPVLMRAMVALGRVDSSGSRVPLIAGLAASTLAVLALAGPAVERRDTLSYRNLDGVLFVVDASSSVTDHPAWPQMLALGRFGLASLGTRPGGIIVYAGDAYVATDMTLDHLQLGQTFSLIDAETVPNTGSRPALALGLAVDLLREARVVAGDVVLFTDGAGLGPASIQAVDGIAQQNARVSIVSLGPLSPEIETHARLGGGVAFGLDQSEGLQALLTESARTRLERQEYPLLYWNDLGRYALLLALFPLLMLFRKETA